MRTPWWSVWRSIAGRRLARCWQSCCYWMLVFCAKVRALFVPQTRIKTVTMQLSDSTSEQGRHTINYMQGFGLLAGGVYGLGMPRRQCRPAKEMLLLRDHNSTGGTSSQQSHHSPAGQAAHLLAVSWCSEVRCSCRDKAFKHLLTFDH